MVLHPLEALSIPVKSMGALVGLLKSERQLIVAALGEFQAAFESIAGKHQRRHEQSDCLVQGETRAGDGFCRSP